MKVDGWTSGYPSVSKALRHYARRIKSERTRETFCSALIRLCKYCGLNPDELVSLSVEDASKTCQDFLDSLRDGDFSIRYINTTLAYLKVFFRENGLELKLERYHQPTRYRKRPEYVPTPDEIFRMAYASGSTENRAIILMLYTSGLRNSTLRALRYGDVRGELESGFTVVKIPVYPEMKKIDPAACKGNIPYYTFADAETVKALKEYLEERRRIFGSIDDREPLFYSATRRFPPQKQRRTPASKIGLDKMVKRSARLAGIKQWRDVTPHCLRKAFESALRNNRLDPKDQEFLMGHILPGSQDAYYDYTKVEELRRKYASVEFFPSRASSEELRKRQVLDMVRILGLPEDRIKRVEEALAKYKTVDEAMGEIRRLALEGYKIREKNSDPKKIVREEELEHYLSEEWEFVSVLPSGRILVRRTL